MKKRFFRIGAALLFAVSLTSACSDDDDTIEIIPDESSISFTINGAVEGVKSGVATVGQTQVGGNYQIRIRGNDGDEETDQSYILDFIRGPQPNPLPDPEPDTYNISTLIEAAGGNGYYVSFVDRPFGDSREFGGAEASGELVITEINSSFVEGTFSFTAKSNETEEVIEVTDGVFKANNNL
ncbi:MAG: hypothetical protein LAT54_07345 [Cryomorphaceae bacterium]|nr:hypothetical protein [Cryomorphaceae bacterium]